MRPVPTTERLQGCRWHDQSAGILPNFRTDPLGGEALERNPLDSLSNPRAVEGFCDFHDACGNPNVAF
jgi:hypothetical protein